jgi:topoisomerase IA-like protein
LRVYLAKDGKKFPRLVHRLVAAASLPNPDNLPQLNHKDGNPENNHVANLEWCTERENSLHAYQFGLCKPPMQNGVSNSNSKLNEQQVREMRKRHADGESSASLARHFGVNPKTANMVVLRQRWAHVD